MAMLAVVTAAVVVVMSVRLVLVDGPVVTVGAGVRTHAGG
jgi:uncharacterized membrane protein